MCDALAVFFFSPSNFCHRTIKEIGDPFVCVFFFLHTAWGWSPPSLSIV